MTFSAHILHILRFYILDCKYLNNYMKTELPLNSYKFNHPITQYVSENIHSIKCIEYALKKMCNELIV